MSSDKLKKIFNLDFQNLTLRNKTTNETKTHICDNPNQKETLTRYFERTGNYEVLN